MNARATSLLSCSPSSCIFGHNESSMRLPFDMHSKHSDAHAFTTSKLIEKSKSEQARNTQHIHFAISTAQISLANRLQCISSFHMYYTLARRPWIDSRKPLYTHVFCLRYNFPMIRKVLVVKIEIAASFTILHRRHNNSIDYPTSNIDQTKRELFSSRFSFVNIYLVRKTVRYAKWLRLPLLIYINK